MDEQPYSRPPSMLHRLLLPLSVGLLLLIALAVFSMYSLQRAHLDDQFRFKVSGVQHQREQLLDAEARLLSAQLDILARDPALRQAFRARDRERLLALTRESSQWLRQQYNITHWYFVLPDQVCFLRVHHPERHGDRIERHTMQRAVATGLPVHGMEWGPYGTFTLRRVHPWVAEGEVLGYLELGIDIASLPDSVVRGFGVEVVIAGLKQGLERERWTAGRRFLGQDDSGWDRLPAQVILASTLPTVPEALLPHLDPRHTIERPELCRIVADGRRFLGATIPLQDAAGQERGLMLVLDDVGAALAIMERSMALLALCGLLLWGGLSALLRAHVRRLEGELGRTLSRLQTREGHLRTILETLPDLVWLKDPQGVYLSCNPRFERFFGAREADIVGRTDYDFVARELADFFRARDQLALAAGKPSLNEEEVTFADDGHRELLETIKTPMRDTNGRLIGVLGIARDITGRRRLEDALKQRAQYQQALLDNFPFLVWLKDEESRFLAVNRPFAEACGLESPELLTGKTDLDVWPRDLAEAYRADDRAVLDSGRSKQVEEEISVGAERRWYETYKSPVRGEGRILGTVGFARDISDRKEAEQEKERLQAQLAQSQKMESVGRLAGGVAHDFNNKLGVILGYAEMALMQAGDNEKLRHFLDEIRTAADRSADLTRQMLAYARKQTVSPRVLDLNETVAGMFKMLQRLIGEDIGLAWLPGAGLWPVKVDPTQVDQILANLAVNAHDAIQGTGKITIETDNVVIRKEYCATHPEAIIGDYVMLAVSDNGCGMSREVQQHVFEPFFTTKEVGRGTGLGLATVYGIARQNQGWVSLYSEPGEGTTLRLYLPRCTESARAAGEGVAAKEPPRGRGETVLLVEDEQPLLDMGRMMLEQLGYTVLAAATPAEALLLARSATVTIDLLLTDVVMPDMNGRQLAEQVMPLHPSCRCLYMSGYTANAIAHHGVLDEGTSFLAKPFSLEDLAGKVRETLRQ